MEPLRQVRQRFVSRLGWELTERCRNVDTSMGKPWDLREQTVGTVFSLLWALMVSEASMGALLPPPADDAAAEGGGGGGNGGGGSPRSRRRRRRRPPASRK